ncbi:M23 family metallopeptidase [Corynebacterium sp. H130]|uniref:M23 family metallopeptidase n=1 Tax=Corynebacterium sp. H130 TaxID=3133444 RepID=UPI0030A83370
MKKLICLILITCSPLLSAYVSPTTGKEYASGIERPFDKPPKNWMKGHRGVDLSSEPGSPIFASGGGAVSYVGVIAGTPTIAIEHPDGIKTTYQPVHAVVSQGDPVTEGQVIGRLAGDHLHWGALIGKDDYINPLTLLKAPTIRLKPLDGPGRKRP